MSFYITTGRGKISRHRSLAAAQKAAAKRARKNRSKLYDIVEVMPDRTEWLQGTIRYDADAPRKIAWSPV